MNQAIISLSGLSVAEVATLAKEGVIHQNHLMALTFEDIAQILPNSSVLVRRQLSNLARFLSDGNDVTDATTMQEVMQGLNAMDRPLAHGPPMQESVMNAKDTLPKGAHDTLFPSRAHSSSKPTRVLETQSSLPTRITPIKSDPDESFTAPTPLSKRHKSSTMTSAAA
jgi:hypothetical protein